MSTHSAKSDPLTTLNVSLPLSQKAFVESVSASEGYTTLSEYVRELIRRDQRARAEQHLDALLLQGIESGEPVAVKSAYWKDKKATLARRATSRKRAKNA